MRLVAPGHVRVGVVLGCAVGVSEQALGARRKIADYLAGQRQRPHAVLRVLSQQPRTAQEGFGDASSFRYPGSETGLGQQADSGVGKRKNVEETDEGMTGDIGPAALHVLA